MRYMIEVVVAKGVIRKVTRALPVIRRGLLGILLFAAPVGLVHAQHAEGHGEGGGHESEGKHALGLFVGNTSEDTREGRRKGFTAGLEYAYHTDSGYGVGVILERVYGDFDEDILVVPVAAYRGPWKFYGGPGFEYADGDFEPLLRLGIERAFEWNGFEIGPQLNVDFVEEEQIIVFGVTFSQRF